MIDTIFLSEWLRLLLTMQSCMLCTKRDDSLVTWKRSISFSWEGRRGEGTGGYTGYFCPSPHIYSAFFSTAGKKWGTFVCSSDIVLVILCIALTPELAAGIQPGPWSSRPCWVAQVATPAALHTTFWCCPGTYGGNLYILIFVAIASSEINNNN